MPSNLPETKLRFATLADKQKIETEAADVKLSLNSFILQKLGLLQPEWGNAQIGEQSKVRNAARVVPVTTGGKQRAKGKRKE